MRAFLCLTPDVQSALAIDRWSAQCWPNIERRVTAQNLHITLAFLGKIEQGKIHQLCELMGEYQSSTAFQMVFNEVGYWPQPQVLWLGSAAPPDEILSLAERCRKLANRIGVKVSRKRFRPHITLARKPVTLPQSPLVEPSFTIDFDAIQLCESILDKRGARYVARDEWPLA